MGENITKLRLGNVFLFVYFYYNLYLASELFDYVIALSNHLLSNCINYLIILLS